MSEYVKFTSKLHARVMESHIDYLLWCPGCEENHCFTVRKDTNIHPHWSFNGNYENPSFSPSLRYPNPPRCHFVLENGIIKYCDDCDHALKSQQVPMVDIDNVDAYHGA